MDWLINHEGEEIPAPSTDQTPSETPKGAEASTELTEHIPGSYKCDDCGKLFRDENSMMFHAAKSGHENFSESSEIEKERRRREEGKKMLETREKQKENELRAIAEERRREKQEEAAARQRVLEQIKADREARKAAQSGVQPAPPTSAPAPAVTAPVHTHDYKQATIQLSAVRLWLELNHSDGTPFTLLQPFPRKVMTDEDYEKPLKELGLVPSANFVMTN
ncbi:UBX domain protein [Oesophagostomum dentatum]|uniref:UBX domain protein n=1 Tax=Oesophagostomum dentatum TaxID=61180 RepID=A0A0B1TNL5_OESDE|nr:UBX domain protein [Oesophagostomum dentatum]